MQVVLKQVFNLLTCIVTDLSQTLRFPFWLWLSLSWLLSTVVRLLYLNNGRPFGWLPIAWYVCRSFMVKPVWLRNLSFCLHPTCSQSGCCGILEFLLEASMYMLRSMRMKRLRTEMCRPELKRWCQPVWDIGWWQKHLWSVLTSGTFIHWVASSEQSLKSQ